jgi:hypothetical protein
MYGSRVELEGVEENGGGESIWLRFPIGHPE